MGGGGTYAARCAEMCTGKEKPVPGRACGGWGWGGGSKCYGFLSCVSCDIVSYKMFYYHGRYFKARAFRVLLQVQNDHKVVRFILYTPPPPVRALPGAWVIKGTIMTRLDPEGLV